MTKYNKNPYSGKRVLRSGYLVIAFLGFSSSGCTAVLSLLATPTPKPRPTFTAALTFTPMSCNHRFFLSDGRVLASAVKVIKLRDVL